MKFFIFISFIFLSLGLLLAACGGGGSDDVSFPTTLFRTTINEDVSSGNSQNQNIPAFTQPAPGQLSPSTQEPDDSTQQPTATLPATTESNGVGLPRNAEPPAHTNPLGEVELSPEEKKENAVEQLDRDASREIIAVCASITSLIDAPQTKNSVYEVLDIFETLPDRIVSQEIKEKILASAGENPNGLLTPEDVEAIKTSEFFKLCQP